MTVKECYEIIGNYDEAMERFSNEDYIIKYLKKFYHEGSYMSLCEAMENKDPKQAFFYVHTLKGLYLNLAILKAAELASRLCDGLRGGSFPEDADNLMDELRQEHERIMDTLSALLNENN